MSAYHGGTQLPNGTFTEALGLMHTGVIDMWASDAQITIPRSEGFLFTTPFNLEMYGALMKRKQPAIFIDWPGLTASIDIQIYAIMFGILALLFFVSWLNERWHTVDEQNTKWHLLLSLFPSNGQMWPNQFGVTRKVLMATCGFGILIVSSIYTAKLSQVMMIPLPPPIVTLEDIEMAVSSQQANLVFESANDRIMNYVKSASKSLSNSLNTHPPIYFSSFLDNIDIINTQNGILIYEESILVHILRSIPPDECGNYIYIVFDDWTRTYTSLLMGREQKDMLESWNVIVAERVSYVNEYIRTYGLSEECRNEIFPVYTPDPIYNPLILADFSGAFSLLACMLTLSLFYLMVEVIYMKFVKTEQPHTSSVMGPFEIHIQVSDSVSSRDKKLVYEKYVEILAIIEKY